MDGGDDHCVSGGGITGEETFGFGHLEFVTEGHLHRAGEQSDTKVSKRLPWDSNILKFTLS